MRNIVLTILILAASIAAQVETLSNSQVIEMSKSGLPTSIIAQKIKDSENSFDVSVGALIELKNAGVDAAIIALMLERAPKTPVPAPAKEGPGFSENVSETTLSRGPTEPRTLAIEKSSIHPSLQALEKELLKRKEWPQFNLAIVRYKESADYYVEIERVPLSLITHRYTFRIYDRRSGTVIAAGETTSWGSLAENLAREIAKSFEKAMTK